MCMEVNVFGVEDVRVLWGIEIIRDEREIRDGEEDVEVGVKVFEESRGLISTVVGGRDKGDKLVGWRLR